MLGGILCVIGIVGMLEDTTGVAIGVTDVVTIVVIDTGTDIFGDL